LRNLAGLNLHGRCRRERPLAKSEAGDILQHTIEALGRARLSAKSIPEFSANERPKDEAEGYEVQAGLAEWFRGEGLGNVAGYKVGATTPAMQQYLGVDAPAYGRIMKANVHVSGTRIDASRFCKPGIECEIAVRIASDIPLQDAEWTREDLAGHIAAIAPAIELVENRYGDFLAAGLGTLIADDFFHKACVLGEFVEDWRALDLPQVSGRTVINGEEVATGDGAQVMGHPLEALVWLANKLHSQGRSLKAGEIVLTGSMTPVIWLETFPTEISIEITVLGGCSVVLS
jgi:2-keto-4-pentenoate hydratase